MNLLKLNDHQLADLRTDVANEISRRTDAAINGHDTAAIIFGNEVAKRALIVAAAGGHSTLFVGPPTCGKTMMRAVALELGLTDTFEVRTCPCGWHCCRNAQCQCDADQISRHAAQFPVTDITIQMEQPQERDRLIPGTTLADMQRQINAAADHTDLRLDSFAEQLLRAAVRELAINEVVRASVVRVARTIANLERSELIQPSHISEAVNYRPLWR